MYELQVWNGFIPPAIPAPFLDCTHPDISFSALQLSALSYFFTASNQMNAWLPEFFFPPKIFLEVESKRLDSGGNKQVSYICSLHKNAR